MLYVPLVLRSIGAVLTPVILLSWRDPRIFVAYVFLWRFCNSSYSFWRIAACAWVCDEHGRSEGMVLGMFSMVHKFGAALTSTLLVLGLSWAGLVTLNCIQEQ